MRLEYNLGKLTREGKLNDLRLELAPRGQCRGYVIDRGGKATLVTREEFDSYYYKKEFVDGPNKDSFGDAPGEPYYPNRQAFGKLKDGRIIYCEISKAYKEKTKTLFEIVENSDKIFCPECGNEAELKKGVIRCINCGYDSVKSNH